MTDHPAGRVEAEHYFDIDGNPISLDRLVRTEPEWAANCIRTLKAERDAAVRERDESNERADEVEAIELLRGAADERAVKVWRAAHPGSELILPDMADLEVWLMEQLDSLLRENGRLREAIVQRRLGPSLRRPGWMDEEADLMGARAALAAAEEQK